MSIPFIDDIFKIADKLKNNICQNLDKKIDYQNLFGSISNSVNKIIQNKSQLTNQKDNWEKTKNDNEDKLEVLNKYQHYDANFEQEEDLEKSDDLNEFKKNDDEIKKQEKIINNNANDEYKMIIMYFKIYCILSNSNNCELIERIKISSSKICQLLESNIANMTITDIINMDEFKRILLDFYLNRENYFIKILNEKIIKMQHKIDAINNNLDNINTDEILNYLIYEKNSI